MKKASTLLALVTAAGLLASGAANNTASAARAVSDTFTTIDENRNITTGAPMNPFNANGNMFLSFNIMQLGWTKNLPTDYNAFFPGLASRWQITDKGQTVTIWIQPKAKWSDGTPVTSKDIVTSMAVAFTQGNAQGFYLGSVKALSKNMVEFKSVPGSNFNLFFRNLMVQDIVPSSVYDAAMPKNIWDIITASQYTGKDSDKLAAAAKAQTQLTNIGKDVANFAPKTDVSAGPFYIKNINPGAALLVKNPYFYAADKVKPSKVVIRNFTGNQQIWNYLIGGQLDTSPFTAMPQNILDQILRTKGNKEVINPSFVGAALAFNQGIYPYGIPEVRKAIAHVIDRNAVQKVAEPVGGTVSKYSTGMIDSAAQQWLTKDQLSKLDTYNHDLDAATQLLEKAGFKKQNGKWMLPNGQPWTATIYTVNGFSDWIEAAKVISSEMTDFGIPTEPSIVSSYSQYLTDIAQDKYAMGFWINALGPAASSTFSRLFGAADGYHVVGGQVQRYPYSDKTKGNWLDTPDTIKLADGTVVNPGKLTGQLNNLATMVQQKPVVQKLALAVNSNLPQYELWNYINVQFVNTNRWTNFPSDPAVLHNPSGVWMALGYVTPSK